jgi:hypothetical protein
MCAAKSIPPATSAAMNNDLRDFAARIEAKSRITFGDVRRLQRDYLPGGLSSFEEARILLHLDANVTRTDRAWFRWLIATIVDFAAPSEGTERCDGDDALETLLALKNASPRARRRIGREIREARRRQPPPVPALQDINDSGEQGMPRADGVLEETFAESSAVVDQGANALPLAA